MPWRDPKAWWRLEAEAYRAEKAERRARDGHWLRQWPRMAAMLDMAAFATAYMWKQWWKHRHGGG